MRRATPPLLAALAYLYRKQPPVARMFLLTELRICNGGATEALGVSGNATAGQVGHQLGSNLGHCTVPC
jgi:hypothetical protein